MDISKGCHTVASFVVYFETCQCVFIFKVTLTRLYFVFLFHLCKMLIESDDCLDSFEEVVDSVVFVR